MADGLFVIIDGHYYAYRFHFGGPQLSAPDGRPTGVTFAFAELFARLRRDPLITHIAAVFDHCDPSFRHLIFPDYKAHRDPMPNELRTQLPDVDAIADAMGIQRLAVAGFEADDVIATLAREADAAGLDARICTRDKDIDQVVTPRISTWDPLKGTLRGPEQVRAERGVDCEQIVDYLCMIGDTADNVPGIRGVGPKTAAQLLQRYGSLAGVFDHLDELTGKRAERIAAFRDEVALTRELIAIVDVPDLPDLDRFAKPDGLPAEAADVLGGFGFSVARFDDAPCLPDAAAGGRYHRLRDETEVIACCDRLRLARRRIALVPLRASDGRLRGVAIASEGDDRDASFLPLETEAATAAVRDLLADAAVPAVINESAGALALLAREGFTLGELAGDPALAAWLLDPDHPHATVAAMVRVHLGEALAGEPDAPTAACVEAQCLLRLDAALATKLAAAGLEHHQRTVELPYCLALAASSARGITLDRAALIQRREHLESYLAQLVAELQAIAGERFNPASPTQVADLLYRRLDLPVPRRTRGGPCIDDQALAGLRTRHEAADLLLQFRQLSRLLGEDLERLDAAADPGTGRIHPGWDPRGEHGGLRRTGCDPANLPGRGELGRELRAALQADAGCELVAVRAPHLRLQLLAALSEDADLADALAGDDDPHRAIAARLYRRDAAGIGPEERRVSRELHRALLDGASPFALAQRLGVPRGEAASLLAEHAELFPTVAAWLERIADEAARSGCARSLHGRQRRLGHGGNATDALRIRRDAIAWTITASAWDLLKQALVQAGAALAHPLLPLDDGLAASCPTATADAAVDTIRAALIAAWPTPTHPTVTIYRGSSLLAVG